MSTNYDWAGLVISRCGLSPTQNNLDNFVRWMAAENRPSDWYHLNNPLNCGLNDGSADGEGSYPSLDYAATETAQVIRQNNMAPIFDALAANASLAGFSAGCAYSAWSTGGYHGVPGYIASIPEPAAIEAPTPFPSPTPAPPPPAPAPPPPAPPSPKKEEDDMPLYTTDSAGTGFVVRSDLSGKTGIPDAEDAQHLLATGLYTNVALDDTLINAIPTLG